MLDPLTSAALTTDRIVELCDELIAVHGFAKDGGLLPNLDAKRTLVPASGRTFARVDSLTCRCSLITCDTVIGETPAAFATSCIVTIP